MKKILFLLFIGTINIYCKDQLAETLKHLSSSSVIVEAKRYIGTRYKLGASTKTTKRFDCSSFVKHVIKKTKHKNLPRTALEQYKYVKKVKQPKVGDMIFFGDSKRYIGHVGIIINPKKKLMIHASSAKGKVIISSYKTKYYKRKYRGIGRI